jgi:tRNA-specific 2-thiouridylase
VECNRHLKFDRLLGRAAQLGFDAVATGHHARIECDSARGRFRLLRGADPAKDQSYVLHMLGQTELSRLRLPVGRLTKPEVRRLAAECGLRTAAKPESQDTCFITATEGREAFLGGRITLHAGRVVEAGSGAEVGAVSAVELVTVGQRRGLGLGGGDRRYAVAVDVPTATVVVGTCDELLCERVELAAWTWVDEAVVAGTNVLVQTSAHGRPVSAVVEERGIRFVTRQRRVAPGQAVVVYDAGRGTEVLGGAVAA